MSSKARIVSLIARVACLLFVAGPVWADTATLKCNSNADQVWVYDSLSTFNVDAKLKCGQSVEVVARVQDYVKIRARNGVEGYVPEATLTGLQPFQPYRDPSRDVGLAAKQIQAKEIAIAAADAASLAPADLNYSAISPSSDSTRRVAERNTSERKPPASDSIATLNAFAEAKPVPAARVVDKTSPSAVVETETPRVQPEVSIPSSSPSAPAADAPAPGVIRPLATAAPSSELSDLRSGSDGSDLACQSYFSAYGLTPNQMKWIVQNRGRTFSSICPAPDPSKVDFVIIFTHDVDFFDATMPAPVHKSSGFSDFTPLATIDTALVPESQADKARHEYVWIFQFEKGTFDPASFSPHRQYQFSKMETNSLGSKAGLKTVEDAFRFVASASR
jgi:hypothetical protein